jgi:hypothetical protein
MEAYSSIEARAIFSARLSVPSSVVVSGDITSTDSQLVLGFSSREQTFRRIMWDGRFHLVKICEVSCR